MSTDLEEPRRGRPRDPAADDRIRQAAAQLLLEHGVDGTTVDAVAERAGVGKATVYRRWASKDDLALAAIETLLLREVQVPDTGSLRGDLTQVYRDLLTLASGAEGHAFFRLAAAEAVRDPRIAALYRESLGRRLELCAPIFDRAVERGELDAGADRQLMFDWPAGVIVLRVLIGSPLPNLEDAATLAEATLRGFARSSAVGGAAG